ncbi:MAG: hypothetical protein GX675_06815 [Erysipelotrichaceae bacterium]|nr:hypothetical protein [Erysipelotrichaceae bacterium]
MLYTDMYYRDYFHKFLVFEVDNLTDDLKEVVDVTNEDCFMLTFNYVDNFGQLMFGVLSIGDRVDNCVKGLDIENPLAIYSGFDLSFFDASVIQPNFKMLTKGYNILEQYEYTNDDLDEIRSETSLDFVRNPFFPDNLLVQYANGSLENDFDIKVTKIGDYIIEGIVEADELNDLNGGLVKAIPYSNMGERRLITVVANEDISDEDMKMLDDFLIELSKGIKKLMPKDITKS